MLASCLEAVAVSFADPLLASGGVPSWVWAALLMAGFVGLSLLTMALARFPVRRRPPPLVGSNEPPDAASKRNDGDAPAPDG